MIAPTPARAQRMERSVFHVWRLAPDAAKAAREGVPGNDLASIERAIAIPENHGATIFVRETATIDGGVTLHVYRIRKGAKPIRYDGARAIYPNTADKLFSLPVNAFDPVTPWRWSPGADVLGGAANLLEQRA